MASGVYSPLKFDTGYYKPAPVFYVGQVYSDLNGTNLCLLTYHSGFYSYAPAYYLGVTAAQSSTSVTATETADTSKNTSVATNVPVITTISAVVAFATLISASSSFAATLTADTQVTDMLKVLLPQLQI